MTRPVRRCVVVVESETLEGYLRDALAHLYDRPYLRTHPLGPLLFGGAQAPSADELRRVLLDAIAQLRPPEPCPPTSPTWRRYRYLVLRYVEGAKPERVALELQVSVRQSRREHDRALEALASILRERYRQPTPRGAAAGSTARETPAEATEPPASGEASDELLRAGSLPPTEPANLGEAVREAAGVVARLAEQHGARMELDLASAPAVRANRVVLRQVLIGLLGCALESCQQPVVRVSAPVGPGVGLDIAAIGAAGQAVASPEAEARLAACRRLAELQGGTLRVDQAERPAEGPGEGLAFRANLRLPPARTRTLLVVDDNPDVAYLFSRFLRGHGYRVLQASTGQAAVELAREARPDAITLDVLMPSQDGWDILRALAGDEETSRIPVILCSVLPERSLALSLGVAEFLNKPVTQPALLAALQRCVPGPE